MSINPGAITLARTPSRAPSIATWRHSPAIAALELSYAGMELPGLIPATEEMKTIEPPVMCGRAALAKRKWDRTFTANTRSHWAAEVPARSSFISSAKGVGYAHSHAQRLSGPGSVRSASSGICETR